MDLGNKEKYHKIMAYASGDYKDMEDFMEAENRR